MRNHKFWIILAALGLFLVGAVLVSAAPLAGYTIDWWTVDGGGGASSAGSYSLSGTLGQPDAGFSSGGGYTLSGGFWGGGGASYRLFLPAVNR